MLRWTILPKAVPLGAVAWRMGEMLEPRLVVPPASLAAEVLQVRVERLVLEALAVRPMAAQQGPQANPGAEAQQGPQAMLAVEVPKRAGPGESPAQPERAAQEVSQAQAGQEPQRAMAVQASEASQGLLVQVARPEVLAVLLGLQGLLGLEAEQAVLPEPEEQGAQLLPVLPTSNAWQV